MLIDQTLSAYRVHENNIFTQAPSLNWMTNGGGRATDWVDIRRCEAIRSLLHESGEKAWRLGAEWRFFTTLGLLLQADSPSKWETAKKPIVQELLAEYVPSLINNFGTACLDKLGSQVGPKSLETIAGRAYANGMPHSVKWSLTKLSFSKD